MIGLRFKNNSNTLLETDIFSFYNQGTTFSSKSKELNLTNLNNLDMNFNLPIISSAVNYVYYLIVNIAALMSSLLIKPFQSDVSESTSIYTNLNTNFYNILLSYDELIFNLVRVIQNLTPVSITTLHNPFYVIFEVIA
jgi:hypothetical protein